MTDNDDASGSAAEAKSPERKANEATVMMKPHFRHSLVGSKLAANTTGFDEVDWKSAMNAYADVADGIRDGNLGQASNMLTAQALTLDAVFTEMLSRASNNLGRYPEAVERYMRLALKAQAQSRATLEALSHMHQPREQVVRHVHVYDGGQAVVAEQLHMHGLGVPNGKSIDQSHATGALGSGECSALPSPHPLGNGVPVASGEGRATLPDARRDQPRRTSRKRQRP